MRDALELAIDQQVEPRHQRSASIFALQIISRVEEILTAGLALTPCECAEAVEPPRNRAGEAEFAFAVGRDGPEQWRARLMGPMGSAKALNGAVRAPARLEQQMDALLLVRHVH